MSSKKTLLMFLVLPSVAVVFSAGFAAAHAEAKSVYPALYVGLAFAAGIEESDAAMEFSSFDGGLGADFWVGVRVNRFLAVEGQLTYLEGFDSEVHDVPIDFEVLGFTGNMKFYPLEGWIEPYLVAGAGVARLNTKFLGRSFDESDVIIRAGGGLDIYFSEGFSVVFGGSYVFTSGDIDQTDIIEIKLGIQHRF